MPSREAIGIEPRTFSPWVPSGLLERSISQVSEAEVELVSPLESSMGSCPRSLMEGKYLLWSEMLIQ